MDVEFITLSAVSETDRSAGDHMECFGAYLPAYRFCIVEILARQPPG